MPSPAEPERDRCNLQDTVMDLEASLPDELTVLSEEECLKERKW